MHSTGKKNFLLSPLANSLCFHPSFINLLIFVKSNRLYSKSLDIKVGVLTFLSGFCMFLLYEYLFENFHPLCYT